MADYGYLNHTFIDEDDNQAIDDIFAAVPSEHIVIEQEWIPGEACRPAFEKMLAKLRPRDVLHISSIDRLGLDVEDTVRLWRNITEDKGAHIIVLDNPVLNSLKNRELTTKQVTILAQDAFAALDTCKLL